MKSIKKCFWYTVYCFKFTYLLVTHPRQTVNEYFGFIIPVFSVIGAIAVMTLSLHVYWTEINTFLKQKYEKTIIIENARASAEPDDKADAPVPEDTPAPEGDRIGDIVKAVYQLESSSGKNDGCRNKGLYNGYGYMQSTYHWKCFETQEEVENLVRNWFVKELETHSLPEALCRYNTGHYTENCPYYEKYQIVKERI